MTATGTAAAPALEFERVTRRFGPVQAVEDLTLAIPGGTVFGFLGPNGAGKTTTIRMLVGLLRPDAGRIVVGGADVVRDPLAAKAKIGYVPDEPYLPAKLTLPEFLRFSASLYGRRDAATARRAAELAERLGLGDRQNELLAGYSHGMRQKASLAAALLHEPAILVLDEPTVGLDPRSARLVKDLVRELAAAGRTVFMSTHILEIAERVCDRVGVIHHGRLIAEGAVPDLRRAAAAGEGATLEDVFLALTAGDDDRSLLRALSG